MTRHFLDAHLDYSTNLVPSPFVSLVYTTTAGLKKRQHKYLTGSISPLLTTVLKIKKKKKKREVTVFFYIYILTILQCFGFVFIYLIVTLTILKCGLSARTHL